ncbi:2'-5' RNA ligase family protein [Phytoactinopolyspora mesophila]|uniref:2'-5' RNA ligase family protein n=1 Tax=Phytoactinopolyspora mesophila TaxID=2650750 RepID=A0A7K3LX92_9ACTN|nr:2'-5' RNA ligase family protein [Phytoactinopolyspora mesophila]NDL55649.1 2'-5' RNA ligase family protein [Phytoactinopolyspora mesophila]
MLVHLPLSRGRSLSRGAAARAPNPVAALGVPAHVTVLFPFVSPPQIDAEVLRRVAAVAATVSPFDYRLSTTAWFNHDVVHLAPDNPAPFVDLTTRIHAAFPDYPPYGGQYSEPIPHLTIGHGGDLTTLSAAEKTVLAHPPVTGRAYRLTLMVEEPGGHWVPRLVFHRMRRRIP